MSTQALLKQCGSASVRSIAWNGVKSFGQRALRRPSASLGADAPLRLTSTEQPAAIDPFGLVFTMQSREGVVRCHVFREAVDELEESHARNGAEMLRRFDVHRRRLERVADRLHGAGHITPWINVEDLLLGISPDAWDYD